MTTSLAITPDAYALLVLHAARHPHATVTGFLLGTSTSGVTTVSKVVPLAHHWTNLAVLEDVGLGLIQQHVESSLDGLSLLGVYEGPAMASASEPSTSSLRLAGKVAQAVKVAKGKGKSAADGSLLFLLQNLFLLTPSQSALLPFLVTAPATATTTKSNSKALDAKSLTVQGGDETIKVLTDLVRNEGLWKEVRDLDDYLENSSSDWLANANVVSKLLTSFSKEQA